MTFRWEKTTHFKLMSTQIASKLLTWRARSDQLHQKILLHRIQRTRWKDYTSPWPLLWHVKKVVESCWKIHSSSQQFPKQKASKGHGKQPNSDLHRSSIRHFSDIRMWILATTKLALIASHKLLDFSTWKTLRQIEAKGWMNTKGIKNQKITESNGLRSHTKFPKIVKWSTSRLSIMSWAKDCNDLRSFVLSHGMEPQLWIILITNLRRWDESQPLCSWWLLRGCIPRVGFPFLSQFSGPGGIEPYRAEIARWYMTLSKLQNGHPHHHPRWMQGPSRQAPRPTPPILTWFAKNNFA